MTTAQTKNGAPPVDPAFAQVKDLNEQFLRAARKAGNLYLDSYEKAVGRAVDLELSLAELTQPEWLKNVMEAQADIARDVTSSYTATARSLLK